MFNSNTSTLCDDSTSPLIIINLSIQRTLERGYEKWNIQNFYNRKRNRRWIVVYATFNWSIWWVLRLKIVHRNSLKPFIVNEMNQSWNENSKCSSKILTLTVDARISCGQHSSRKLLHTFGSLNFNAARSFSP